MWHFTLEISLSDPSHWLESPTGFDALAGNFHIKTNYSFKCLGAEDTSRRDPPCRRIKHFPDLHGTADEIAILSAGVHRSR
jgi:hypothetical protein